MRKTIRCLLYVCLSASAFASVSASIYLSDSVSVHLSACVCVCLPVSCLSASLKTINQLSTWLLTPFSPNEGVGRTNCFSCTVCFHWLVLVCAWCTINLSHCQRERNLTQVLERRDVWRKGIKSVWRCYFLYTGRRKQYKGVFSFKAARTCRGAVREIFGGLKLK